MAEAAAIVAGAVVGCGIMVWQPRSRGMMVRKVGVLIAGAGLTALVGCQGANLSPQPGPHVNLDTLRPTADFYARVDKPLEQSGPSLAGMSRDNWDQTVFYVPVSGVENKPTYTTDLPRRTDSTARQRGEFPTQASAVEGTDADSTGEQALEAVWGPVRAGWDILWMIPKMFDTPPGRTVSSPRDGYERRPHPTLANNGGLKDGGLGVSLQPLAHKAELEPTTPASDLPHPPQPEVTPPPEVPAPGAVEPAVPAAEPTPPTTPPQGVPSGAIGGSDSPKRREQKKPKEQKP